ncbi:MAG: DNA repair protein RecN [Bacteroidales bacterium]|nr:DNA repair protein RecN [Bacteroidales bacterium]MCF8391718.1 DNA repair protein RecN [Bacteroidales bacterium]
MLKSLFIKNYAIIRELDMNFQSGFTTMTGETGAGKSIMLGALGLVLGQRADSSVLQDKEGKCVVEAIFENIDKQVIRFLNANEIDEAGELIIRREISDNGKSRAFINDSPANLLLLKDLGQLLIDVHSQHENLDLGNHQYQINAIDAYGGTQAKSEAFRIAYLLYKEKQKAYREELENRDKSLQELDFITFQYEELEKAKLIPNELGELEEEIERLQHTEDIKSAMYNVWHLLNGGEQNATGMIRSALAELKKTAAFHKSAAEFIERLESSQIELKDIATEAETLSELTVNDPKLLEHKEERLNLLNILMQKHHLKSSEELILLRDKLSNQIYDLESLEFKLEEMGKGLTQMQNQLMEEAGKLSELRMQNADAFQSKITNLLIQLGIPNAGFVVANEKMAELTENGIDDIRFHFKANKNTPLQEIGKIASGGELSRLMLSIKSVISGSLGLPTIIFDEIDSGVSGEIAHRIANIMKEMSRDRQVLSITHLPQVAAAGNQHFYVYKEDTNDSTETRIKELNIDERLIEIAKMLSGKETTNAAVENAKELLSNA